MNRNSFAHLGLWWLTLGALLLLAGCEPSTSSNDTDATPPGTAQLEAWVGAQASEFTLRLSEDLPDAEFYASSDADCDFDNYGVCANARLHLNVTDGSRFTDTTTTLAYPGSHQLRQGNWRADAGLSTQFFSSRAGQQVVVFKGRLWLIGGGYDNPNNDVWSSSDGISWEQQTTSGEIFTPRYGHQVVVFKEDSSKDEQLWLIGGADGFDEGDNSMNDVWSSSDGISWQQKTPEADFSARDGHQVVVFKEKLWLFGGYSNAELVMKDTWSSSNGVDWEV